MTAQSVSCGYPARVRPLAKLSFVLALAGISVAVSGCGSPAAPRPAAKTNEPKGEIERFGWPATLHLEKEPLRTAGLTPRAMERLDASAFRFSRMLARQFEARTCWAFRDLRWILPVVAVHGDPHVEQFVVTRDTHGLEDFDQAGYGPAVVDLVRYAASLHLACRESKWPCDANKAVEHYFTQYREALDHPPRRNVPSIVERLRQKAPQNRAAWLDWVDTKLTPLSAADEALTRSKWAAFTALQKDVHADRPAAFYEITRFGQLKLGVGSALERKMLFRIQGPTADAADDVVLEARLSSYESSSGCVWRPAHDSSLHVLTFMSLLGPRMPDVMGFVSFDKGEGARRYWVQSWNPGYVELSLADIGNQDELNELADDAARQLAGHFWARSPDPLHAYQRYAQLQAFDAVRERALVLARALADESVVEWERFRVTK
jgi:thiamine kinase-like enzyme